MIHVAAEKIPSEYGGVQEEEGRYEKDNCRGLKRMNGRSGERVTSEYRFKEDIWKKCE